MKLINISILVIFISSCIDYVEVSNSDYAITQYEPVCIAKGESYCFGCFCTGEECTVSYEMIKEFESFNIVPEQVTLKFGFHKAVFSVLGFDNNWACIQFLAELIEEDDPVGT
ncbi:hypothetical protein ACFLTH_00675 [Bacteroidota bacterium]